MSSEQILSTMNSPRVREAVATLESALQSTNMTLQEQFAVCAALVAKQLSVFPEADQDNMVDGFSDVVRLKLSER